MVNKESFVDKKFMKTIILCGGKGTRLGNESNYIPKAMVKLGHRPIIWHVMKRYGLFGFTDFILALGSKGELIRDYFTRYDWYTNDIRVNLQTRRVDELSKHQETDWKVTLVDTGNLAFSGARIHRCKQYIEGKEFMVTYADCLADLDIKKLVNFHRKTKKIATVTGVIPPYREGEFLVKKNLAVRFYEAKEEDKGYPRRYINGGYMVFKREIFSYLTSFNESKLETRVFSHLIKDKELAIYPYHGFWRWLDAERDYNYLNELVNKNKMYWLYK